MSGCKGCEGALYGCPWEDEDISDCDDKAVIERMTKLAYKTGRSDAIEEFRGELADMRQKANEFHESDYVTGFISAISTLEGFLATIKEQKND